jgi:hypothetical protein
MKRDQAPHSLEDNVNAIVSRLDRVERRPPSGGGGGTTVYVQSNEPLEVPIGSLWFDIDEVCS